MKKNDKTLFLTSLVCLIPIIIGLFLWNRLPDTIAIHFNIDGVADRYTSKLIGILIAPIICSLSNFIIHFVMKWELRAKTQNVKVLALVMWIIPIATNYIQFLILSHALGRERNIIKISLFLLGFLFTIIGNYLPKIQQDHAIGIRVPWTLRDTDNWRKTHRLGGFLWTIGGIIIIASIPLLPNDTPRFTLWFGGGILFIMALIPLLYSWLLSQKE